MPLPQNIHNEIGYAVRREVPRAVETNLGLIAKAVEAELAADKQAPVYQAQATNISVVVVPQYSAIPFNTLVLDHAFGEIVKNPDGSFTVSRGIWSVAWSVMDAATAGLIVDNVIISQGVSGETDLIEIVNKTATVKVIAATGDVTLQAAPATQASIAFTRLACPRRVPSPK